MTPPGSVPPHLGRAMGRLLRRVESGRKKKQDTPMKTALFGRIGLKKQMGRRIYEALPEEDEVGHVQTVQPTVSETEADTGAEGSDCSDSSLSLVIDTSHTSDEQRSPVDTSSSLPSPEVFRDEQDVEPCTLRLDDDLADALLPVKNSTLLDLSHAETILAHQPPDLSNITDAPTILAENSPQEISTKSRKPSDACKKAQTPAQLRMKKSIFLKKRVWFRSPLFSEKSKRENAANPEAKRSNDEIPKRNEGEREEADGGAFFAFASDSERDGFFRRTRERCFKLKNAAVFPLTAARLKN